MMERIEPGLRSQDRHLRRLEKICRRRSQPIKSSIGRRIKLNLSPRSTNQPTVQNGPLETSMTTQDAPSARDRSFSTRAFHGVYIVAAIVASLGWGWLLLYFATMLLGL